MDLLIRLWDLVLERHEELLQLTIEHLELSIASVLVAALVAVPLGIFLSGRPRAAAVGLGIANVLQSMPTIALLAFAVPFVGIGAPAAVVMVVIYALLPMLKNTYTGVTGIDPKLLEVARGMGMSRARYLRSVALPLALPQIMAGIRIAAVSAVGTMTIAAFAGAGGLGWYINLGLSSQRSELVLLGAIPSSLMAVALDALLGAVERGLTPNARRERTPRARLRRAIPIALAVILSIVPPAHALKNVLWQDRTPVVTVGSANFTEGNLLAEMCAQLIEAKTGIKVDRRFNLNGEGIAYTALEAGEIDIMAGYSGAVLMNFLHEELPSTDPDAVFRQLSSGLDQKRIMHTAPFGFGNTYVMTVAKKTAQEKHLASLPDLMRAAPELRLGATVEFITRSDGLEGLQKQYGTRFADARGLDAALRYKALAAGEVDVVDAFSTDGLLETLDVALMKDVDHFFPPYDAFGMVRADVAEAHPGVLEAVKTLEGLLDEAAVRRLNYQIDVQGQSAEETARAFLLERGLLKD